MALTSRPRADEAAPIGRDAEAERLTRLIDEAAAGAKRAALLLGVPGIGKTTLLRSARSHAERRGLVSTYVRVPATAGLPPRFPLGELLDSFVDACERDRTEVPERLRRVVDTLTGTTSVEEYAVSLPQIAEALEEVGRHGPIGVFVDDYDWAPLEGTELLMATLRVIETPVFFLATARLHGAGEEPPSPLPAPTSDLWIEHIEVRGLDPQAVGTLAVAQLGGEVLPSLSDALFARTLGNPLFVGETLQAWRDQRALEQTAGFWGLSEHTPLNEPGSLRDMISARLAKLEDDALSVAGALAVIGREADIDQIAFVGNVTSDRMSDILSLLAANGFVTSEGSASLCYRVAHPLYVTALIDRLGATRVGSFHARVCEELRRRRTAGCYISASELAHHAVRALHPPADLRSLLAAAAAEAESAGSFDEAAMWYGHLAEVSDDPHELVRALSGQATASIRTDPVRSVQLFTYALELEKDPPARARLLLGRARAHRCAGSGELIMEDLEHALPLAGPAELFDIRHAIGIAHGMCGRFDEAELVFRSLVAESEGTPQHWKAIGHLGMVAFIRGDLATGAQLQQTALEGNDDPTYDLYLRVNLAWILIILGRWDEGEVMGKVALEAAVRAGNTVEEAALSCDAARLEAWRGNLPIALDFAQRSLRLASLLGNPSDVIVAHDALALALLENDMPQEAASMLSTVIALDGGVNEPREFSLSYTFFAEACLLCGDLSGAWTALERARDHLPDAPYWVVAVDRVEAQIESFTRDYGRALELLQRWLDAPSALVFEQARVLETASIALQMIGDRDGARARAQEALLVFERFGARKAAGRVATWLAEHAVRKQGRPRSTLPGRLTERETETLRLIVLGRSNREIAEELFISVGTVKKHVENIMSKAGVFRRTELVPFALGIGVLAMEDLRNEPTRRGSGQGSRRKVVRLDLLEASEPVMRD